MKITWPAVGKELSTPPHRMSEKEPMTIVVPVKNRATLVLRTLNSIRQQTWRPLKVIVVDNGSVDGTPDSVKSWIKENLEKGFDVSVEEEPKPGAAAARNLGLQAVDTRLMMFFDSDDIMAPRHVESVMARFYAGDDPDLVCFRVRFHPLDGEETVTRRPGRDLMMTHICHSLMRTQGYACETALARRAGGWDEDTRGWDDLEFGSRVLMEARKRVFISDVNVDVYAQVDSITGVEFTSRRGEWEKALDKMEENFKKSRHKNREKWLRAISYKRAILASHYKKEKSEADAARLLRKALENPLLGKMQKLYLQAAYLYTSLGGRGAAIPANLILS